MTTDRDLGGLRVAVGRTMKAEEGMRAGAPHLTPLEIRRQLPGSNHSRLLQLLHESGDLSRADLARAVGLTKATVSSLIAEMIREGLVVETRQRAVDGPGRPAVDLNIDRLNWLVAAVDLSPDRELRGALIDLAGNVHVRESIATEGALGDAALQKTIELIDRLILRADRRILGVGVCAPGTVDNEGRVLASHNLDWVGLPLKAEIERHTDLPTCVANDANAAALAERDLYASEEDLMLVKIGFGVGAGIITNGQLVQGSRFTAGEIGHVAVGGDGGPRCVCGREGCLEATLSLPRLAARVEESPEAARDGVLRDAGECLAIVLAPLVGSLGLEAVVVTGLVDPFVEPILSSTRDALRARLASEVVDSLDLRVSEVGDDLVLQGAMSLVASAVLGIQ